jgi:hypothetical protein
VFSLKLNLFNIPVPEPIVLEVEIKINLRQSVPALMAALLLIAFGNAVHIFPFGFIVN